MNRKLVVIVGHSGAGKTTLARMLAEKNDYALLSENDFVFQMNPASLQRKLRRDSDRIYGQNILKLALTVYLGTGRSTVVEGDFVGGPLYLDDFRQLAEKNDFQFVPVMLVGEELRRRRRRLRAGGFLPVSQAQDARMRREARKRGYPEECYQIDTTKQNLAKTYSLLDEHVQNWPFLDLELK